MASLIKFVIIQVYVLFVILQNVTSLETPTASGQSLVEGQIATILCENRLVNGNATLVWSRSDQAGVDQGGQYSVEEIANTNIWLATKTYTFTPHRNMNRNPSLKFRCTASFNGESKHTDWSVFVYVKPTGPEITSSNVVAAVKPTGPEITSSNVVAAGQSSTLTCEATNGKPVATLTWRVGSQYHEGSSTESFNGDSTYDVVSRLSQTFTPADNGTTIYCDMSHSVANSARSVSQKLVVQFGPNVTVPSTSYTVSENQTVILECSVVSVPSASSVSWTKDGAAIDRTSGRFTNGNSASKPSLTITNVQPTDGGTYVCSATNTIATANSPDVTLNVRYAPKLALSPPLTETNEETTIQLSCTIDSKPAITEIRWIQIKDNRTSPLVLSGRFTGGSLTNPSNLTISFVQPVDGAEYKCEAVNGEGTGQSGAVSLVVYYSPRAVVISPSNITVKEGERIYFHCSSEANPAATYTWHFQSETTAISSDAILSIPAATIANIGQYVCVASNSRGSANKTATVDVLYPPRIQVSDIPLSANTGEATLTIECVIEANPPASTVSWKKNLVVLDLTTPVGKYSGGAVSSPSLVIHSVEVSDEGSYTCGAQNSQSVMVFSNSVEVKISYAPKNLNIIPSTSVTLQEGDNSVLACEADGVPTPTFVWTLNDVVKTVGRNLTFASATPEDAGTYICNVTNMRGSSTINATVIVEYSPKINLPKSSFGADRGDNLAIAYSLQAFPAITTLEWFKDNNKLDLTNPAGKYQGGTASSSSLVINDLQPADAGSYIMRVSNSKGTTPTDPIIVAINYSPRATRTIPSNDTMITEGTAVVFQCDTDSFPAASFRWTKGSTRLADSANLTILLVSPADSGQLTCTATNTKGSDSVNLNVVVKYVPRPDHAYTVVTTSVGVAVTLRCATHAVPPETTYHWKYANRTLSENGSTLIITPTSSSGSYFGVYVCLASNEVGTSEDILIVLQETKTTLPPKFGASTDGGGLSSALIALIVLIIAVVIVAIILIICCLYKQGVCSKVFHRKRTGKGRVGPADQRALAAVENPHLTSYQKPIPGNGYTSSNSRNPSSTAVSRKDVDVKYADVNHFTRSSEKKLILEDEDDRKTLIPNGTGPIISLQNKPFQLPPLGHDPGEESPEKKKKRKKRRRYKREETPPIPENGQQPSVKPDDEYVTPVFEHTEHTYSTVA